MPYESSRTGLVVSAHSADFVWRAGGAIALYANRGYRIVVVCLSFGERGESGKLWKQSGIGLGAIKEARREEAEEAAGILGAQCRFMDLGDYPLHPTPSALEDLAALNQELRPEFILTHSLQDPYNFDHPRAAALAQEARIVAQAHGFRPEGRVLGAPPVFLFEPHQPEQCQWRPDLLLDISEVWETKARAFKRMAAQEHLWEYYTRVALQRGVQAKRNSGLPVRHAEGYMSIFPRVSAEF